MSIYDFSVGGKSLSDYKGKVLLVVNTATRCGLTPQYDALQKLYDTYKDRGFEVLDFPSNQFLEQAPESDDEIHEFCQMNFGTSFPRFKKIDVNGEGADPLFVWLKEQKPTDLGDAQTKAFEEKVKAYTPDSQPGDIKWNFGKFLIDRDGNVVERFSPATPPEQLANEIEKLL